MKIKFCGPQNVVAIDPDGDHEVVETQLLHRFTLVDGEVVDKYPGKTDREIAKIEHDEAKVAVLAAQKAYDDLTEEEKARPDAVRPADLPEFAFRGE